MYLTNCIVIHICEYLIFQSPRQMKYLANKSFLQYIDGIFKVLWIHSSVLAVNCVSTHPIQLPLVVQCPGSMSGNENNILNS